LHAVVHRELRIETHRYQRREFHFSNLARKEGWLVRQGQVESLCGSRDVGTGHGVPGRRGCRDGAVADAHHAGARTP